MQHRCSMLSIPTFKCIFAFRSSEDNEREDMLNSKAILSSFGILMPTACYLGFDPFNDLTNPLSTNVVISDGRNFKFTSYQLNKTELVDANENSQVKNVL